MKLNPRLDPDALRKQYRRDKRLHVGGVLDEDDARTLYEACCGETGWNFVFYANDRHFDLDAEGWRGLDREKRETTEKIIFAQAAGKFSYMYDNIPVYDRYHAGAGLSPKLRELFEFLNGEPFLDFARRLTGADDIGFADAQATRYGPGHFLTAHNDDVEGKDRRAAYVLNLTPQWREDWGGYLNFFDGAGHIEAAYKPAFNALNVFSVPRAHSVGYVAPFAAARRYSITGWLRAGVDPAAK